MVIGAPELVRRGTVMGPRFEVLDVAPETAREVKTEVFGVNRAYELLRGGSGRRRRGGDTHGVGSGCVGGGMPDRRPVLENVTPEGKVDGVSR